MADSGYGRQRRRSPVISPVLRPRLWAALLGAVAAAALATPAYADPAVPTSVPDTGSRPVASTPLQLPGGAPAAGVPGVPGTPVGNPGASALEAQISALEIRVGQLGTQLLQLKQQRTEAEAQLATADQALQLARDTLTQAQQRADLAAVEAIKADAALPPGEFAADLHKLSLLQQLSRGEQTEHTTSAVAGDLVRAGTGEQVAYQAYVAAESRANGVREQYAAAEKALRDEEAKLLKLRQDNAAQLLEIARRQEAAEQQLGAGYIANETANGLAAHPIALAAVAYAKAQLGDPYLWGAEGPDRFDCSGLVWAAYRSAGYNGLPRVSRDQYYATRSRTVARTALLPGDLVFFASGSSWTSIHHMGMYVGGGKMIHAPTTGDVVKISTVSWSRLYAATRVVGAVPAPATTPPSTSPPPSPTPSPTPSKSPKPSPTPSKSPTPSPRPPSTGTGSPKPPPSPTPSDSPSPSPSESPELASPSTDASGAASPSTSSADPGDSASASTGR